MGKKIEGPVYPATFDECKMDVPEYPNVEFQFTVEAPRDYTFDAWNLSTADGGNWRVIKPGDGKSGWPVCEHDMERELVGLDCPQILGNVETPDEDEDGHGTCPWRVEWKAGAPYFDLCAAPRAPAAKTERAHPPLLATRLRRPYPVSLMFKSVHGIATFVDGPGPNQTTVKISGHYKPGLFLNFTRYGVKGSLPNLCKDAPKRFADSKYVGPTQKASSRSFR